MNQFGEEHRGIGLQSSKAVGLVQEALLDNVLGYSFVKTLAR